MNVKVRGRPQNVHGFPKEKSDFESSLQALTHAKPHPTDDPKRKNRFIIGLMVLSPTSDILFKPVYALTRRVGDMHSAAPFSLRSWVFYNLEMF